MSEQKNSLKYVFQQFLVDQKLVNQKIIIAVSGGVDSMVLLDIANQVVERKNLAVFHVNHNTRTQNITEQNFLAKLCQSQNITFLTYTLNEKSTQNQENNWRNARKKFGIDAKKKFGATHILTAHHATDLVETMIFRLTKGAGPRGLCPFDTTTKPFWQIPKKNLLDYARANNLNWFEDDSNQDTTFQRNLIRHDVLPALRKITPNLEQVFVKEAKLFGQLEVYLEKTVQTILNQYISNSGQASDLNPKTQTAIPLSDFLGWDLFIQKAILRKISDGTPSSAEINDCLRWLQNNPAGQSEKKINGVKIIINKNKIVF